MSFESRVARGRGDVLEIREATTASAGEERAADAYAARRFPVMEDSYNRCGLHECDLRNSAEFFFVERPKLKALIQWLQPSFLSRNSYPGSMV